ncbi:MAG: hypothetical protein UU32_C0012G0006 [Candidatus Woesebacteria bacterium GW2011_GWB1_41_10]|uniref:Ribbon-helix-helix protein CopG domain-containing protein n=1 Tax=Candidatus Woesebacteria bacterium GW2011_GWB1_41_10 TaxID=1618577 RepID=A0A0G0UCK7_9BACT|nr:MAG: hypothetical protein UU32_C0012G0006 [Candidatus Woesebacteria bacterium GW2011_GWB1_41_10]
MQTVATNIRFPKEDYEDLRVLAFQENSSIASLVNAAVKEYKLKKLAQDRQDKMELFERMWKSRIKIKTSTTDLVRESRKSA